MRSIPIFTVFYSTTFSITVILLVALLLLLPADHIYQALHKQQLYYAFLIAAAHLLTLLIAAFIWAGRLYKSRSTLVAVPRSWNPLEKGDAPRSVGRLVREGLERSARVGWEGRPRETRDELLDVNVVDGDESVEARRGSPHWGIISHPGWSSPESKDLPNLHLPPIVLELPHLIEAKAVSLAPPASPSSAATLGLTDTSNETSLPPSPLAISLLQRPAALDLRAYLTHLSSLNLINPPALAPTFLTLYERARFSPSAIPEHEFRNLMSIFANLLQGMKALDPDLVTELRATEIAEEEEANITWAPHLGGYDGAQDDDRPRSSLETTSTVAHTPMPAPYASSPSSAGASQPSLRTAPSAQRRSESPEGSVVQHRGLRTPSIATLRSFRSRASSVLTGGSVGAGSVIHLAEAEGGLDLPRVRDGV